MTHCGWSYLASRFLIVTRDVATINICWALRTLVTPTTVRPMSVGGQKRSLTIILVRAYVPHKVTTLHFFLRLNSPTNRSGKKLQTRKIPPKLNDKCRVLITSKSDLCKILRTTLMYWRKDLNTVYQDSWTSQIRLPILRVVFSMSTLIRIARKYTKGVHFFFVPCKKKIYISSDGVPEWDTKASLLRTRGGGERGRETS